MSLEEMQFRSKYIYEVRFGNKNHIWTVECARGALHLHITDLGSSASYERYSCGIETHWRTPPKYMQHKPPDHQDCWILKCPCWHDGSSLRAREYWLPLWLDSPSDHDRTLGLLETEASEVFQKAPDN